MVRCFATLASLLCSLKMAMAHAPNPPALWEAKVGVSPEVRSSRLAWPTWWNPISTRSTKISQAWRHTPVVPATWATKAEESLEPRRRRLQWAEIVPLHSSWVTEWDSTSKKKKKNYPGVVACTHSPSYLGGWGRRIARPRKAEVTVNQDNATDSSLGSKARLGLLKKKNENMSWLLLGNYVIFPMSLILPFEITFFLGSDRT